MTSYPVTYLRPSEKSFIETSSPGTFCGKIIDVQNCREIVGFKKLFNKRLAFLATFKDNWVPRVSYVL